MSSVMLRVMTAAAATMAIACSGGVDVEDIPLGTTVQVTRDDGALVEGRLAEKSDEAVTIERGTPARPKAVPVAEIADVRVVPAEAPLPEPPPLAKFREFDVPAGTTLALEIGTALNTGANTAGDTFEAVLTEPVVIDGVDVLPAGSVVSGRVTESVASGKVKGRAHLALAFDRVSAHGETYPVAAAFEATAPSTKGDDAKKIGIPAAGGAILGAVLGGGKGAAIGAAIGGGGGAAAVLLTKGGEIEVAKGAKLSVATGRPIEVKVPISTPKLAS